MTHGVRTLVSIGLAVAIIIVGSQFMAPATATVVGGIIGVIAAFTLPVKKTSGK